jgi:2-hydroxy-3-oxopropionate reductase
MKIGFVGLGLMGRPMALNLVKAGHDLTVWARRAESMQPLLAAGARAAASPAELAAGVEVVISIVADSPDVRELMLGARGVCAGAQPGLIAIDMSTILPAVAKKIGEELRKQGVEFLDAPVSGGEPGAIAATLTIMVGGSEAAFARARPIFECLGKTITHIGDCGAGQVAKAANQILTGVGVLAVAEALNFARRHTVDPAKVRQALMGGNAYSKVLENHGQRMLERKFKPGFKSHMHQKDMNIVMQSAYELGLCQPAAAAAAQMFNAMVGTGLGDEDSVAMIKLLESLSAGDD